MTVLVLIETVVLVVLCVLVAGLLRGYGTVLRRLHQLDGDAGGSDGSRDFTLLPLVDRPADEPPLRPRTAPAPAAEFGDAHDIAGETLAGEIVSARVVGTGNDTLLLFLSSGCASCATFWEELGRPGSIHLPAGTRLLVVPQSPADESVSDLVAMAPPGIDVVLSSRAWRDYGVPGSPHVVYVDGASGRIRGEGTGQSLGQVADLLARSTGDAGFVTGERSRKPARDAEQEAAVDRELLAAGILPGDPRLYGAAEEPAGHGGLGGHAHG
ncbi:hypothetical protein SAMN05443575_1586 [Jatrophihabitans endophyticus]|uniref:Thioredoxin domain-containing protein n=1 Tax=Jatrophihabitans endophyticus TaxID=1206085 RepID=A0A1M5HP27_9ACTN|nr:hypothetical protein [Jatrophihabitans endophyticus]SHG17690.1 hypothetical protein SAMN05443575_1586 [Jatrophihabitans endophyticus]